MSSTERSAEALQLGERLREIRDTRGLTQEALAKSIGVTERTVRGYEAGERPIPSDALQSMGRQGFDIVYLLAGIRLDEALQQESAVDDALLSEVVEWVDGPWRGEFPEHMSDIERIRWIVTFYLKALRMDRMPTASTGSGAQTRRRRA